MTHKPQLSGEDIDNILDEIDEKENQINNRKIINYDANWNEIIKQLRNKNIEWIKHLVRTKQIGINTTEPTTGNTLLIYAVCIGDLDLVKVIVNFGADVRIKNSYNLDAFDYAMRYCRRPITELIFYRQLIGLLGNDLKNINTQISKKNKEANYIYQYAKFPEEIIDFTIKAIEDRADLNENMLYYSWYFVLLSSAKENTNPFDSILWKTIMNVYENILANTNDKKSWIWMKERLINSYIWYLPHPNNKTQEQKDNNDGILDMESVLKTTLFHELLIRVRVETQKQSDLLLKTNINQMISETRLWNELIAFNKQTHGNRQDNSGCHVPKYARVDLSDDKFPPSIYFSASRYYDMNVYCSELVFRANTIDEMFQVQMQSITKQINEAVGTKAVYRAGPVKTLMRAQKKAAIDCVYEDYPTCAAVKDMTRCAIEFNGIKDMLEYLKILSNRIEHKQAGCITDILGSKNGWSVFNPNYPSYTDIKINVMVQSNVNGKIIAEIQCLLNVMSAFKRKTHRLNSITQKFQMVYNYQNIARKMGAFLHSDDINVVFHDIALKDNLRYFRDLWENIPYSIYNLAAHKNCIHIIMSPGGTIHKYLTDNYRELYRESLLFYINSVIKLWFMVLEEVTTCGYDPVQFIQKFIHLFDTSINIETIKDGTETLRSFNIIFDLLTHNIYSFINEDNNKIKAPICTNFNGCNYHSNTHFKLVSDTFEGGTCYAFGDGANGQLGLKEYEAKVCTKPNIVIEFDNNHQHVLAMDSYNSHHLGIDVNHKVYSWGNNEFGQLGDGKKLFAKASKPIPNLLKSFNKYNVISVAVGSSHSLILTNDGNIWSFGDNRKGQLGNGKISKEGDKNPTPKVIKKLSEMKDEYFINISAGSEHSGAVSKNGKLYCWGSNEHGECGADPDLGKIMVVPYEVDINSEYKDRNDMNPFYGLEAGCGWNYTLLLTTNHSVLQFGKSMVEETQHWKPLVISNLSHKRIMHMSCSYHHCLLVTENGELYTFGSGACGRLGHGMDTVEILPKRCEYFVQKNIKIIDCECGSRHSGVISDTGELYMFGRNGSRELGYKYVQEKKDEHDNSDPHNSIPRKVEFFNNKKVRYMSLGIKHSHIVVSDDDEKKNDDDAHYLNPNQEERIWCPQFKMYIKNEKLFGNNWILLAQKK